MATPSYLMFSHPDTIDFTVNGLNYQVLRQPGHNVMIMSPSDEFAGELCIKGEIFHNDVKYNVSVIRYNAFRGCESITALRIIDSDIYIAREAFISCPNLETIEIVNSFVEIGENAFYQSRALNSHLVKLSIFYSLVVIGEEAFWGCKELENLDFKESIVEIGKYSFADCEGFVNLNLNNCVTEIGDLAFYQCFNLSKLTIPPSVTTVDSSIFIGCYNLNTIYSAAKNPLPMNNGFDSFHMLKDITLNVPKGYIESYREAWKYYNFTDIKEYEPLSVAKDDEMLKEGATFYNRGFQFKILDSDKRTVGVWRNPEGYRGDIVIPETATFQGMRYRVTEILSNAFSFSSITSVKIPDFITKIGAMAFYYCSELKSVEIGDGVETIRCYTFTRCYNLESISLGNNIKEIRRKAFRWCRPINKIEFPKSLAYISEWAFEDCDNLHEILFSSPLPPQIDDSAFSCYCFDYEGDFYRVSTLYVPYGCIGNYKYELDRFINIFDDKPSFQEFSINGISWRILSEKDGTLEIASCLDKSIENIEIPETISYSGKKYKVCAVGNHAFFRCSNLVSIKLPSGVRRIGIGAFYGCYHLRTLIIQEGLETILNGAFIECMRYDNYIFDLFVLCKVPPKLEEYVFGVYKPLHTLHVHVPNGTAETYKSSPYWGWCNNLIECNVSE